MKLHFFYRRKKNRVPVEEGAGDFYKNRAGLIKNK